MASQYTKYVQPRLQNDPEFRAKYNEIQNKRLIRRYHEDPEFRQKQLDKAKIRLKNRYDTDPEYREHQREKARRQCNARKALKLSLVANNAQLVC